MSNTSILGSAARSHCCKPSGLRCPEGKREAGAPQAILLAELCDATGEKPSMEPAATRQESRSEPLRLLAVDDSPLSRKLIEYSLADAGYEVSFASDGAGAIRKFNDHPSDIVITDWVMDDCSGPDLCRKIRREFSEAYTYLVLLTSNTDSQSIAQGLEAGADDYLKKPFDRDELRARVGVGRRVIEMHRSIEAQNRLLRIQAATDPLTGLANRRAIEEWITKQIAGANRHGYPIWLVLIDLESHKHLTDRFGRATGDAVLKAFAEILKTNTRVSDMCGHFGGDQFAVVLTHVNQDGVAVVIDRLKEGMVHESVRINGTRTMLVASFGRAGSVPGKPTDLASLVKEADARLVAAKGALRR